MEGLGKKIEGTQVPFKVVRKEKAEEEMANSYFDDSDDDEEYDNPVSRKSCLFQ